MLAVTVVPIAAGFVLRPPAAGSDDDVALLRWIKARYAPILDRCLRHPRLVALAHPAGGRAVRSALGLMVGSDFMPQLDEGAFLLQTVLPTEASLEEVDRLNHRVEDMLREVPEVDDVVRRTGRAERTEDPMPHTMSDVLVTLKADRDARSRRDRGRHARAARASARASPCCSRRRSACASTKGSAARRPTSRCASSGRTSTSWRVWPSRPSASWAASTGSTDLRAEALTGLPQLQIAVDRAGDGARRASRRAT